MTYHEKPVYDRFSPKYSGVTLGHGEGGRTHYDY